MGVLRDRKRSRPHSRDTGDRGIGCNLVLTLTRGLWRGRRIGNRGGVSDWRHAGRYDNRRAIVFLLAEFGKAKLGEAKLGERDLAALDLGRAIGLGRTIGRWFHALGWRRADRLHTHRRYRADRGSHMGTIPPVARLGISNQDH